MDKDLKWVRRWMSLVAQRIADQREYLIELDRQIGDGDHGENLDRGFTAVMRGGGLDDADSVTGALKYVAKTLLSTVGGAAGPLYGTGFLRGGAAVGDELTPASVAAFLTAAAAGIQERGKAVAGEKTMVDALLPAATAATMTQADGDVLETLQAAAAGAQEGAEATIPMKATKGRASYLGERSRGHLDPGAVSSAMIVQAAADAWEEILAEADSDSD